MRHTFLSVSVSASALLSATAVFAQAPAVAPAAPQVESETEGADAQQGDPIVVTGSRIARRDYTSASPIVTTGQEALQASGQPNIEAALTQMPQFSGGRGGSTSSLGGGGFATINLRGLGDNRNLVLLDGRRLPIASSSGVTDINILPQAMIGNVEVISGGASAVYGSDAISGVVNFKTRNLKGVEIDLQNNISEQGDAYVFSGSLSYGTEFGGGRGTLFLTGSYNHRARLLGKDRDFFNRGGGSGSVPSGAVLLSGTAPTQAAVDTVFASYGFAPGTVSRTSRFGFNNDGTLYAVTGGYNLKDDSGRYGLLGGQAVYFNVQDTTIITGQERYNLFGKATYELTDGITAYTQVLYSHSNVVDARAFPVTAPTNPTIPITNPFIPADLLTLLQSRSAGSNTLLFKAFEETGAREYDYTFETYQVVAGLRGELAGGLNWDAYVSVDGSNQTENINHVVLLPRVQRLLSAADGGASICAGGYNPFSEAGSAGISQACRDYITAPTSSRTEIRQNIVEANLNGNLFELPAGMVKFSVTGTYRENKFSANPDILLIPNYDYTGSAYADLAGTLYPNSPAAATNAIAPISGKVNVKEISGELLIPLLEGRPFAQSLNLSLGGRYSHYNLTGGATTYKAELDWRPVSALLLRGGYERAIRAPNIAELFTQIGTTTTLGATPAGGDPCDVRTSARTGSNGANVLALCQAQFQAAGLTAAQASTALQTYTFPNTVVGSRITGNSDLSPEKADTFTLGAVLTPRFDAEFIRRLSFSVDYYNIEVSNAIATISGATALSKCFNLDGSNPGYDPANQYCSTIVRSAGTGILFDVGSPYLNIGGYKTSGIDFQFDAEFALGGSLRFGLNSVFSRLIDFRVQSLPNAPFQNYAGTIGTATAATPPLPTWKGLTTATVSYGDASLGLRWRFLDAMKDVSSVTSATPAAGVGAYHLFDLIGRIPVQDRFELRLGVNNLFNREPPVVGGVLSQTNATVYDIVGRSFYAGVKAKF